MFIILAFAGYEVRKRLRLSGLRKLPLLLLPIEDETDWLVVEDIRQVVT